MKKIKWNLYIQDSVEIQYKRCVLNKTIIIIVRDLINDDIIINNKR